MIPIAPVPCPQRRPLQTNTIIDPIKLREKARLLRKETGDDRWKSPMEKSTKSIPRTIGLSLLRPFQLLIFEPMCLLLCIFSAILLGVLYLFFGAFGVIFGHNYGFNLWQTGLSFLGIFVGMVVCSVTDPLWRRVHGWLVERNNGIQEPEFRLGPAIAGSIVVPIGLFWFAWTTYPHVHWIMPIIGSGIFGCGVSHLPGNYGVSSPFSAAQIACFVTCGAYYSMIVLATVLLPLSLSNVTDHVRDRRCFVLPGYSHFSVSTP